MYENLTVGAVVPAYNEQDNVGTVVADILQLRAGQGTRLVDDLVVCDNGSTDATAERAEGAGARVAHEPRQGYGQACLTAIDALEPVDVVLFVDGDQAFHVGQSLDLLAAIVAGADLVIGSRALGRRERGALSPPQRMGNLVASWMIRLLWKCPVTDLGPFRAIRSDALRRLGMSGTAYGWTVEMQVKAIQCGMRVVEVAVDSRRRRFGKSKVSGTVKGVVGAGLGILSTIGRLWLRGPPGHPADNIPGADGRSANEPKPD